MLLPVMGVAVVGITLAGYPGVVCVTPMVWLLALSVGLRCAQRSTSPTASRRILEAGLLEQRRERYDSSAKFRES